MIAFLFIKLEDGLCVEAHLRVRGVRLRLRLRLRLRIETHLWLHNFVFTVQLFENTSRC